MSSTLKKSVRALAAAGLVLGATHALAAGTFVFRLAAPGIRPDTPYSFASLSVGSLDFGGVAVGATSSAKAVQLSNAGTGALAISSIKPNGNYAVTSNCGASLPAGSSCTLNLTFSPTNVNANPGSVVVTDASGVQSVTLTGIGLQTFLSAAPTALAFGNVTVGQPSASQSFTLTNTGNQAAGGLSILASSGYSQTNNCGSSLAAGASCTVSVTFTPPGAAPDNGSISIASGSASASVSLTGTGATPTFSLSPMSMAFGAVIVGSNSAAQTYTLQNTGTVPLVIGATTVPSRAALATDNCSNRSLAAGASCTGSVYINPPSATAYSGTLSIATNGSSASTIALSGYGAQYDALLGPANIVATGEANVAWIGTGYGWVWNTSGYASSVAVGDVHFETLLSNGSGAPMQVYLHVAADNVVDGFKLGGVSQTLGCLATTGFAGVCTVGPYTIAPGTTRLDLSVNNGGAAPNPAGISAWVTSSSGAVLSSTSNTSQFFWTSAGF
jgi:hypothetical protein